MTTTTLSSKQRFGSLLGGMLKKNRATMFYLAALTFVLFPLQYILETQRVQRITVNGVVTGGWRANFDLVGPAQIHTWISIVAVFFIFIGASLVIALTQASYMHNRRAVDVYHALPVSRGALLTANAASAFLTVAIPMVLNYLVVMVYGGWRAATLLTRTSETNFTFSLPAILLDLSGWLMTVLAIVAVTMLVATQVCSVFDNFIFLGEVLVAIPLVKLVIYLLCSLMLTGYCYAPTFKSVASWSPVLIMLGRYIDSDNLAHYGWMILAWALAAAAALWLAVLLYRRRHSEMAESVGRGGALAWFCKALAALLGAAALGAILYGTFGVLLGVSSVARSRIGFVLGAAIGSALFCLLMEAILNRGFRGLGKQLAGDAAICGALTLLSLLLVTGGAGFESRIPAADSIASVDVRYRGKYSYCALLDAATGEESTYYTEDDEIGKRWHYNQHYTIPLTDVSAIDSVVRPLHQAMLDAERDGGAERSQSITFTYTLKNGKTMIREYNALSEEAMALLLALESQPDFYEQTNPVFTVQPADIDVAYITDCRGFDISELRDSDELELLLEALRADVAADDNPTDYRLPLAYITFDTGIPEWYSDEKPLEKDTWCSFSFGIQPEYKQTLTVLAQLTHRSFAKSFAEVNAVRIGNYSAYGCDNTYAGFSRATTYYRMDELTSGERTGEKEAYAYDDRELITDEAQVAELLALAEKADGLRSDNEQYLYLTFYNIDGERTTLGATVLVDYADAPAWVWELLYQDPEYYEKYGYPSADVEMAETVAVPTA